MGRNMKEAGALGRWVDDDDAHTSVTEKYLHRKPGVEDITYVRFLWGKPI